MTRTAATRLRASCSTRRLNPTAFVLQLEQKIKELEQAIRDKAWNEVNGKTYTLLSSNDPTMPTELNWSGKEIGDGVAAELAVSLEPNTTLKRLILDHNQISDRGARQLLKALRSTGSDISVTLLPNKSIREPTTLADLRDLNTRWCVHPPADSWLPAGGGRSTTLHLTAALRRLVASSLPVAALRRSRSRKMAVMPPPTHDGNEVRLVAF